MAENAGSLVDAGQLAEALNVPLSWIRERSRRGRPELPLLRVGRYVRFDVGEVRAYLRRRYPNERMPEPCPPLSCMAPTLHREL